MQVLVGYIKASTACYIKASIVLAVVWQAPFCYVCMIIANQASHDYICKASNLAIAKQASHDYIWQSKQFGYSKASQAHYVRSVKGHRRIIETELLQPKE